MAEDIQKFDPSTLMQGVKDRIKATFVSLIPDAQWEQMVNSEIKQFFEKRDRSYSHNNNSWRSEFTEVVWGVLSEECKKRAKAILDHPDFAINWDGNQQVLSEKLREMLIAKMPEIMVSLMQNAVANTIQDLKNRGY